MSEEERGRAYVTHKEFESFSKQVFDEFRAIRNDLKSSQVKTLDYIPLIGLLCVIAGAILWPQITANNRQDRALTTLNVQAFENAKEQGRLEEWKSQQQRWHADLSQETHEALTILRQERVGIEAWKLEIVEWKGEIQSKVDQALAHAAEANHPYGVLREVDALKAMLTALQKEIDRVNEHGSDVWKDRERTD